MSPKPLNQFCASIDHVAVATHKVEITLEGLNIEIGLCTPCRRRLPQIINGDHYEVDDDAE